MASSVAKLSLAAFGIGGSVGLGAYGVHYFKKNTASEESGGTVKDFFVNKGFVITDDNDPIWTEEFQRYRKLGSGAEFSDTIDSLVKLKNKCKEVVSQKFDESMLTEASPSRFRFIFGSCAGKTPFLVILKEGGIPRRKINISADAEHWEAIATKESSKSFANEIGAEGSNLEGEQWKQKIKDYCKEADWNQEMRKVKDDSPILALCTIESSPSSSVKEE